jgi:hypothetical protein
MSQHPAIPIPLLKSITSFYHDQDGSKTWKELIPSLVVHLHAIRPETHTDDELSKTLTVIFQHVRRIRRQEQALKAAVADYERAEKERGVGRWTEKRQAAWERNYAGVIVAYHNRKEITLNRQEKAEEELAVAAERMRERGAEKRAREAQEKQEEKERKKQERQERKQAAEKESAKKREEKKKEAQEKKRKEQEQKILLRDKRANQLFDLKQAKLDRSQMREADVQMDRKVKRELLETLGLTKRILRRMEEEMGGGGDADAEEEEDKENMDPLSDM